MLDKLRRNNLSALIEKDPKGNFGIHILQSGCRKKHLWQKLWGKFEGEFLTASSRG
jgi:hypothetical protein